MEPRQYIDEFCHYDKALQHHLVCPQFFFAKIREEIVPNRDDGWWEIPTDPVRHMNWRAHYIAGNAGPYEDHSGDHYQLWDCPWCGGETEPVRRNEPRILPRGGPTSDGE